MSTKINARSMRALLGAGNPKEYIEKSIKSRLSTAQKARVTRLWLERHREYTIKDIEYARNRHPYWKARKTERSLQRTKDRYKQYAHFADDSYRKKWSAEDIDQFLKFNDRMKDYELAEMLHKTIPAIQSYRRKIRLIERIRKYRRSVRVRTLIEKAEKVLSRIVRELESGRSIDWQAVGIAAQRREKASVRGSKKRTMTVMTGKPSLARKAGRNKRDMKRKKA